MSILKLNLAELLNKYENDSELSGGKVRPSKKISKRVSPSTKKSSPSKRKSPSKRLSPSTKKSSPSKRKSPSTKKSSPSKRVSPSTKKSSPSTKKSSPSTKKSLPIKELGEKMMKDEIVKSVVKIVQDEISERIEEEIEKRFGSLMVKYGNLLKELESLKTIVNELQVQTQRDNEDENYIDIEALDKI